MILIEIPVGVLVSAFFIIGLLLGIVVTLLFNKEAR